MATRAIVCAFILAACLNFILAEDIDEDYQVEKNSRVVGKFGRAYSLTSCNYEEQIGYSCLSCNRALHCYFGGVAILVDCFGAFRYCRDGRCARKQGAKCFEDNKITTTAPELMNLTTYDENVVDNVSDPVGPSFASESSANL